MSLTTTILQNLSGDPIHRLALAAGATSERATSAAVLAVPMMLGAAGAHSPGEGGIRSMLDFVDREHGQILDDLEGYLSNDLAHFTDRQHGPDIGLVGLLFGAHGAHAAELLARHTGLESIQAMRLMGMLAPVVLSQLARVQSRHAWSDGELTGFVRAETERAPKLAAEVIEASRQLVNTGDERRLDEALGTGWWKDTLARIG